MIETLIPTLFGGTGVLMGVLLLMLVLSRFLYICKPNEILIFSGRSSSRDGGRGYKVVQAGRQLRLPIIERVSRMDLTAMSVEVNVRNAYSKGGIPLILSAVGVVKINPQAPMVNNAIERFLGRDRGEIRQVAQETLEGHLRGVLANLTPEQVNEDRLAFADELRSQAKPDLDKLGLQLDALKIHKVTDEVDYLSSIGREAIARIIRDAEIAESNATNEADRVEAECEGRAAVAEAQAQEAMARLRNELRSLQAELTAQIESSERRAKAAGEQARMEAEEELQRVRAELEHLRRQAMEVLPAEAAREAEEYRAQGNAAEILEEGKAMRQMLEEITESWSAAGPQAATMLLIRQLEQVLGRVATAVAQVKVGEVQLVDRGDGSALPAYVRSYPAMVTAILDEVRKAAGIDIAGVLDRLQESPAATNSQEAR